MKITTFGFALLLFACFAASAQSKSGGTPPSLTDILRGVPSSPEGSGVAPIRYNAIRETAMTYGSQAGLAYRSHEILKNLEASAQKLDVVYNFQALMVEGNVVPPVLTELTEVFDQPSDDHIRVIGKVYRIDQQARFSYTPPSWRSYVHRDYAFDQNVVANVAPKSDEELKIWRASVEEGYKLGEQLANANLSENFARLQKDFRGMILYHRMLTDGMVTKPYVASSNLGVTRTADGAMHVGEVILRITANPDFVDAPGSWQSGPKNVISDRLKRSVDPAFGEQMMRDAQKSGLVKDKGRTQ